MRNLEKRLAELEKQIKAAGDSPVWIDGKNNLVRVDIGRRRGQPLTFPTVLDARLWIEKQIDAHAGGIIGYSVDNLADLHEDAGELRAVLKRIIPEPIVVPDLAPRVVDGQLVYREKTGAANHPQTFDADSNLPGILAMSSIAPGMAADLRLWCLASLITRYFDKPVFRERLVSGQSTEDDGRMFAALLAVYAWKRPGSPEELQAGFLRLFCQVLALEVEMATTPAGDN